jgi:hypothetical protein
MDRQDLILISAFYALIIAAGHSGPLLNQLKKLPWNDPLGLRVRAGAGLSGLDAFWVGQDRLFTRVEGIFGPPETLASPAKKAGSGPEGARRSAPVLAAVHPVLNRVRPFARVRRMPEPKIQGTNRFNRERGPQG